MDMTGGHACVCRDKDKPERRSARSATVLEDIGPARESAHCESKCEREKR